MTSVSVTELRKHCYQIFDQISKTGESIVVTKLGNPIAVIVRHKPEWKQPYRLGLFAGKAVIVGDLIEPINLDGSRN